MPDPGMVEIIIVKRRRAMKNFITKALVALGGLAVAGTLLTACGSDQPQTYAPAAYGQNGVCYYVDSPAEVVALQNAGLCPRNWVAGPMPGYWLNEYYPYYDSPSYYNSYVPVRYRAGYVRTEATYYKTHTSAIRTASSRAVYKSSSGSTVKGSTILKGKTTFGSGTSFGTSGAKYGSGSLRSGTRSGTTSRSGYSSGSTSSRTSGGFGGGGLRSSSHR
jgi:hypothetical protein